MTRSKNPATTTAYPLTSSTVPSKHHAIGTNTAPPHGNHFITKQRICQKLPAVMERIMRPSRGISKQCCIFWRMKEGRWYMSQMGMDGCQFMRLVGFYEKETSVIIKCFLCWCRFNIGPLNFLTHYIGSTSWQRGNHKNTTRSRS